MHGCAANDENKETVLSRLNDKMLQDLAEKGRRQLYFNVIDGDDAVADALGKPGIDKLEKRDFEVQGFSSFNSYFQYFVFVGLALLVVDWFVSWKKHKLEE
ncbi:MAG: hypothetical protein IPM82_16380, partial [Saprospiraceae bacterium]|nr:hypothetical protein [Saprospiraceae bacterium]